MVELKKKKKQRFFVCCVVINSSGVHFTKASDCSYVPERTYLEGSMADIVALTIRPEQPSGSVPSIRLTIDC